MTYTPAYGYKPSLKDQRDWRLNFSGFGDVAASVDLRDTGLLPAIWNQGQLGSCTAHGASAAYSYDCAKQGGERNFTPARLFVYYNTRVIEGTVGSDSGASITDCIKSINQYGCPPESDWAYDISQFTVRPPDQAFADGAQRQAVKYARVNQTAYDMQACLTAGTPIVVGFTVYESFESSYTAQTGEVSMPASTERVLGGHCVVIVGYTNRNGRNVWIVRNSWGTGWGDQGYCYFPQEFFLDSNLADDFWTVQQVESPSPAPTPPGPQPTPSPQPVPSNVSAADKALWSATKTWANGRHWGTAKTTATALKTWAKAKKLA